MPEDMWVCGLCLPRLVWPVGDPARHYFPQLLGQFLVHFGPHLASEVVPEAVLKGSKIRSKKWKGLKREKATKGTHGNSDSGSPGSPGKGRGGG